MIALGVVCIALVFLLARVWVEKEYWAKKYADTQFRMPDIQWDYTKEFGWRDDE